MENQDVINIQLHYRFNTDNLHSMNAEIFNECERQFIKALKSTEKYIGDTLIINIKPRENGSLIDFLTVVADRAAVVADRAAVVADRAADIVNSAAIIALVTTFAKKFFDAKFSSAMPKTDETRKKLDNIQKIKEEIKNGELTETDFDYIACNDKDLKKLKSNFFKNAKKEQQIKEIEVTANCNNSQPMAIAVDRKDFDNFIISETESISSSTQNAKIYIAVPILMKLRGVGYLWKGIFETTPIEFKISDKDFLEQVKNQAIQFSNGTYINCELKTTTKTNTETDEIKISREVTNVSNWGDDVNGFKQIERKRKPSNSNATQLSFSFNDTE